MPNEGSSEAPARWVVVVPLGDAALFDYLTRSFAAVPDVRVVHERRRSRPTSAGADDSLPEDRRARPRVVANFGCAVIRRPSAVVPDTPASTGRTLLWPHLRITDVLTWKSESASGGSPSTPENGYDAAHAGPRR